MPTISFIPDRYKEGFKKIALFEDDEFAAVESGLSYTSLVSSLKILASKVAEMKGINSKDVEKIFLSIGSLVPALESQDNIRDIAEDIANASTDNNLIEIERKDVFIKRLLSLLSNKQIYYASKSNFLNSEKENIFIGSRIITDIRPVFDIDLEETPKAGMIIHSLHIHYRADAEADHKDLFIALKSEDIKTLKEALDRAEKKEISLQPIFEKTGMTNLNE